MDLQTSFRIDPHTVIPARNLIVTPAGEHRVEPKIMEVLVALAETPGQVVSREKILNAVWGDTLVGEEVVSRAISELRKVLGDDAKSAKYIETIPKKGYRLVAEVKDASPSESKPDEKEKRFVTGNPAVIGFIAAVLFISVTGGIVLYHVMGVGAADSPRRIVPFTSYPGEETDPALSPDGGRLAFTRTDTSGSKNVFIKLLNSEQSLQLTNSRLYEFAPAWSPDGSRIAFARFFEGLFAVPSLGGPEVKLTDIGRGSYPELDWSPDGNHIVFSDRPSASDPYRLYMLDLATHNKHMVTEPGNPFRDDYYPRYSPDGNRIAFLRGTQHSNDIYVYDLRERKTVRVTQDNLDVEGFSWTNDGRSIIFSSNRGGTYGLWQTGIGGGAIRPFNRGANNLTYPSVARNKDGAVAFVKTEEDSNIWLIPVDGSDVSMRQHLVSTSSDRTPHISPDGSDIVFVSHRSGTPELWISDRAGTSVRKITSFNGPYVSNPYWSPDGDMILCDVRTEGNAGIYRVDVKKGQAVPLIEGHSSNMLPRYSKDGASIYFTSNRTGSWELWKSDGEGSNIRQITEKGGYAAEEASDGTLYYSKVNESGVWMVEPADSREVKLFELSGINRANWSLTDRGIYFIDFKKTVPHLQFYSFTAKTVTDIGRLDKEGIWYEAGLSAFPDGSGVLYTRLDRRDLDIMGYQ